MLMILERFNAPSTSARVFMHNKHLSMRSSGPVHEDMTDLVSITFVGKKTDLVNASTTKIK